MTNYEIYKAKQTANFLVLKDLLQSYFKTDGKDRCFFNTYDIEMYLTETLPSGSGIDCKWEFEFYKNGKIKISNSWHKMNDNGFYCGFTDFYLVISYTETDKIEISNVKMSKGERFGVREYLNDIFHYYETELNK